MVSSADLSVCLSAGWLQFGHLRGSVVQLIQHQQLVERSVSSAQHTLHHNSLLMAQQQDESRLLREKYRQIEALYRYQSSRGSSLESKLDECITEKLQLQQENRKIKHDAARWEHSRAVNSRRVQAAANSRLDPRRARDEQTRPGETLDADHEDGISADDDHRYPLSPLTAAPASPIRLGSHSERPRVDLTPAAAASHFHSASLHPSVSIRSTTSLPAATAPGSYQSDSRSFSHAGLDTRPSFTSSARKYNTSHE